MRAGFRWLVTLIPLSSLCWPAQAAEPFPSGPLTIVVPYTASGPTDSIARLLATSFSKSIGQPVTVENVAGDGGTKGSARVAKAPADGHTMLLHHFALAASATLYPKLPYDAVKDFEPIGLVNFGPYVLAARTSLPVATLQDAIKYVKASKGKATFGHAGVGSGSYLCNLMLNSAMKAKFTEKAYRGTGPAMTDLAAGQIDFLCDQTVNVVPSLQKKTVKALAVSSAMRPETMKQVPTFAEAGVKGFDLTQWHALYVPKRTPKAKIVKLEAALATALKDEAVSQGFDGFGTFLFPEKQRGSAAARKWLEGEVVKWRTVIKAANVQITQ